MRCQCSNEKTVWALTVAAVSLGMGMVFVVSYFSLRSVIYQQSQDTAPDPLSDLNSTMTSLMTSTAITDQAPVATRNHTQQYCTKPDSEQTFNKLHLTSLDVLFGGMMMVKNESSKQGNINTTQGLKVQLENVSRTKKSTNHLGMVDITQGSRNKTSGLEGTDGSQQQNKTKKADYKGRIDPEICMQLNVFSPRTWVTSEDGDRVMCDTQTDGGGWIVIQRRTLGETMFNRSWEEYKVGFSGERGDEFYIGNEALEALSLSSALVLRVDLVHGTLKYFQMYKDFRISDETGSYSLCVVDWTGTAGDGLTPMDVYGQRSVPSVPFSTYDRPSASGCGSTNQGGWWSQGCHGSNLNGEWKRGVQWLRLPLGNDSITFTEMKVRPEKN